MGPSGPSHCFRFESTASRPFASPPRETPEPESALEPADDYSPESTWQCACELRRRIRRPLSLAARVLRQLPLGRNRLLEREWRSEDSCEHDNTLCRTVSPIPKNQVGQVRQQAGAHRHRDQEHEKHNGADGGPRSLTDDDDLPCVHALAPFRPLRQIHCIARSLSTWQMPQISRPRPFGGKRVIRCRCSKSAPVSNVVDVPSAGSIRTSLCWSTNRRLAIFGPQPKRYPPKYGRDRI
jgi:hypothetical protein